MTSRRPFAIALAASAFYAGIFVTNAKAEMHYVRVTLVTGQQLTISVDIPPGTPVDQLQIPGLPAPVASIVDLGSTDSTPTPTAAPTVAATPTATQSPKPSATATPRSPSKHGSAGKPIAKPKPNVDKPANQTTGAANTESLTGKVATPTPTPKATTVPDDQAQPPAKSNPTFSLATPGAAKPGVPNFFIDKFRIPPFLLPIYQAAGTEYGIRREVLAAINEIETNYGRNLNVSSAGAEGWMQFMPATWKTWGVDANQDGYADPLNPVDAIFTAARYLKAAGAETDLRKAVFAYNHANWYVDSVLLRAQVIGGLPTNLVTSLTGLTEGRFPVAAEATYADEVTKKSLKVKRRQSAAVAVESTKGRRGISVYADAGSPVVAVSDAQVTRIGISKRLGNFIQIQDAYGNTYTYGRLAKISRLYAAPKPHKLDPAEVRRQLALPRSDKAPTRAASETEAPAKKKRKHKVSEAVTADTVAAAPQTPVKTRLFAHPTRANAAAAGGAEQQFLSTGRIDGALTPAQALGLPRNQ